MRLIALILLLTLASCAQQIGGGEVVAEDTVRSTSSPRADTQEQVLSLLAVATQTQLSGPPVGLDVNHFAEVNGWAFVTAGLRTPTGEPYPLTQSSLAERAREGAADARVSALMQRDTQGDWQVRALDVGSTDIPWLAWIQRYDAPAEVLPAGAAYEVPAWGDP